MIHHWKGALLCVSRKKGACLQGLALGRKTNTSKMTALWLFCYKNDELENKVSGKLFPLIEEHNDIKKVTEEQQQLTETSTGMSSYSLAIAFLKVSFLCWKASIVLWSA